MDLLLTGSANVKLKSFEQKAVEAGRDRALRPKARPPCTAL